jgi:hypothetical protein
LNVIASGGSVSAAAVQSTGEGTLLTGSISGSTMTMGWKPLISPGVYGTGTVTGTISGATVSGSWSNTLGESGTWTASTTTCG